MLLSGSKLVWDMQVQCYLVQCLLGSMISVYLLTGHDEIRSKIRFYASFFLGLAVSLLVINICQQQRFAVMIRERMLPNILTFELGWFDQDENSSAAVCSRIVKDATVVRYFITKDLGEIIIDCFNLQVRSLVGDRMALPIQTFSAATVAAVMGLVIVWRLALVMIAVQPPIIICFYGR